MKRAESTPIDPERARFALPEALPAGERILWQGGPDAESLARHAYAVRLVAAYFGLVVVWRAASVWSDGASLATIGATIAWTLLPALLALLPLWGLARLQARATVYTLTNRRIAMRIGLALPANVNIPLSKIVAVDRRELPGGRCDLVLTVEGGDEPLGFALLWPHVRIGGRGTGAQPVLRCLAEPERVSTLLADALAVELTPSLAGAAIHAMPAAQRERTQRRAERPAALAS
jgi:hypothetical protein